MNDDDATSPSRNTNDNQYPTRLDGILNAKKDGVGL